MDALTLLRELVARPSINPAFQERRQELTGEARVADYLEEVGRKAGLDVSRQEVFPGRDNLILRMAPAEKVTRSILLAPHMDTVGVPEDGLLTPVVKGGRLIGRGACDTKGSIAAMLSALLETANSGNRPRQTEIMLVALVDEEDAQSGSRAFAAKHAPATLAIVGEPTELKVVTAHKGDIWLKLTTHGKAAHSSKPHLGKNAVLLMAQVVQALEGPYADKLKKRRHPLLGSPTVNVGAIRGGTQANIVPAVCEILLDRRTVPGETEPAVCAEINAFLKERKLAATMERHKTAEALPMQTNPVLPVVKEFLKHARQRRTFGVDYFCDASILSCGGTPSVVFGPGSIAQAHTSDEYISIKSLETATDILKRFLQAQP